MQILAQVEARRTDARALPGTQIVLPILRWLCLLHVVVRDVGLTVEVSERGTLGSVSHHEKVAGRGIGTGWRLEGDLDTVFDHFWLHRPHQIEALTDRAGRRQ